MKKLETLFEGMYFVPQVVPEIQNKTIDALNKKGYQFANWIKPEDRADQEDGKGAAMLTKRTSKFSHSFIQVGPDGSINGEPPEMFLNREDKASAPVAMDEYSLAMGIKPKNEMATMGIPEDTSDTMGTTMEEVHVRGKKVNIDSIELDEGEGNNAKAVKAHYVDGTPLTDEELDELNNPGKSTGVPNVKQQPDLVRGVPSTVIGEEQETSEGHDNLEYHTSVKDGKFLPSGFGNKNFVYLHDLETKSPSTGGPQLVTVNDINTAKQIANQFSGKVVKTKLGTFRIVQPAKQSVMESEIPPAAIEKGTKHEMEHTKDPLVAKKIAMDHLRDDPHYYEKLAKAGLEEADGAVYGMSDAEITKVVTDIEKQYGYAMHPSDWNEVCTVLLSRANNDNKIIPFPRGNVTNN